MNNKQPLIMLDENVIKGEIFQLTPYIMSVEDSTQIDK